jgi:hypothetical protein
MYGWMYKLFVYVDMCCRSMCIYLYRSVCIYKCAHVGAFVNVGVCLSLCVRSMYCMCICIHLCMYM